MDKETALRMELENFIIPTMFFEGEFTGKILSYEELNEEEIYSTYKVTFDEDKINFPYKLEDFKIEIEEEKELKIIVINFPQNKSKEYVGEKIIMFIYHIKEIVSFRYYFILGRINGKRTLRQIDNVMETEMKAQFNEETSCLRILKVAMEFAQFCFKRDIMSLTHMLYQSVREKIPEEVIENLPKEILEELEGEKVYRFVVDLGEEY